MVNADTNIWFKGGTNLILLLTTLDSNKKYSEDEICRMLDFLIGKIFVMFGGCVFQQTVCIPMGTNCALFLLYSFIRMKLTSYRSLILQRIEKKLAQSFGFTFCYIDGVHSLNKSKYGDYVDLIYPNELEI